MSLFACIEDAKPSGRLAVGNGFKINSLRFWIAVKQLLKLLYLLCPLLPEANGLLQQRDCGDLPAANAPAGLLIFCDGFIESLQPAIIAVVAIIKAVFLIKAVNLKINFRKCCDNFRAGRR